MITSVFCLGLLNGCNRYSCDFHSSEEAQKYVLAKLKDKYKEEFVITKVKTYKEEKIGLNWVIAEVVSKENSSKQLPYMHEIRDILKMIITPIIFQNS